MEQALTENPKGLEIILLGNLNARLRGLNTRLGELRDKQKEELATALSNHGLEDVNRHFTPQHWYRRQGRWMCQIHRDGRQGRGRGDYVLDKYQV